MISSAACGGLFSHRKQAAVDFVGRGCDIISLAAGGGLFCWRQAASSGRRRLILAGCGGLGCWQAAVCSGLSSAAGGGGFH